MKPKPLLWYLFPMIILLAFISFECSSQLSQRSKVIEHAFDYSNIDSTLANTYSDDIRFELGEIILEGKQEMRSGAEWDSVINSHLSFSDFKMNGDTVICKCTEENDLDKLQGIEHGYFDPVTFVFKNEQIKYVSFKRTSESRSASATTFRSLFEWASRERKEELEKLLPGGKFILSAESARGWLALAREWRNTIKPK